LAFGWGWRLSPFIGLFEAPVGVANASRARQSRALRRDRYFALWCLAMRVVGRRQHGSGDREGLDALVLAFGGGAPKGVFRCRSQEAANRDRERWTSERVQRRIGTWGESPSSSKTRT
jgi:hypothetical protein